MCFISSVTARGAGTVSQVGRTRSKCAYHVQVGLFCWLANSTGDKVSVSKTTARCLFEVHHSL